MRFIHLSDLHLGKRVNEFSMIKDQEYILKEILTIIKDIKPDGVLIAGDIYDRSVPSEEAMMLWDDFLISLSEKKIPVYAISGNHDSAIRFFDHGALVESVGVYLSPVYDGNAKKYTLEDEYGPLNIYMLPFIKPAVVKNIFPEEEINSYTDACRVAVEHMEIDSNERNILIAHQFVTGAERCDSEEVVVGGLDNVDADVFSEFDYVALGHLHGKQSIKKETVRYCGTPLKYSFSEKNQTKSVTIVDIAQKGDVRISEKELIPLFDMREIRGNYDELMDRNNYENTNVNDYIRAVLTDEDDVPDAISKLRVVYPNIMVLNYDNKRTKGQQIVTASNQVENKSPIELFDEFYEKQNNQPMSDEQREFVAVQIEKIWESE